MHIDGHLTNTATPVENGPGGNSNKKVTPYSIELQNWSLIIGCCFVSYTGRFLF